MALSRDIQPIFHARGIVESDGVRHYHVLILGAVWGVCFAALAARSLSHAFVNPRFRVYSIVYGLVALVLAYFAFRAAIAGRTDEESFLRALWGGFAGAVVGAIVMGTVYTMFRDTAREHFARPLGVHLSQLSAFRLLLSFLFLGFGAGFALTTKKAERP